jgi:hypothetical protein
VLLPAHLLHNLGNRGTVFALQHHNDLSGLAALARRAGYRLGWLRGLSAFCVLF